MTEKRFSTVAACILVVGFVSGAILAGAQEDGGGSGMSAELQAEMEAWMKLAQPGEHHKHMDAYVGSWKGEVTMWMSADGPPMTEQARTEVAWILGGRFLQWKNVGNYSGMPYESVAIEGYNNGDQRYESLWMDNFGTIMLFFTGSSSDDGKQREMTTTFNDVVAGGTVEYRAVYQWTDDDHFSYTAYMDKGDGEFKNVEVLYSRQ